MRLPRQARELAEKEEGITELNREFRDLEEEVRLLQTGLTLVNIRTVSFWLSHYRRIRDPGFSSKSMALRGYVVLAVSLPCYDHFQSPGNRQRHRSGISRL